jgi:hypothetical protein
VPLRFAFVPPCLPVRQCTAVESKGRGTSAFSFSLPLAWNLQIGNGWDFGMGGVMDAKLAMLVVLFGSIIGLSYLTAENLARLKRWRKAAP